MASLVKAAFISEIQNLKCEPCITRLGHGVCEPITVVWGGAPIKVHSLRWRAFYSFLCKSGAKKI